MGKETHRSCKAALLACGPPGSEGYEACLHARNVRPDPASVTCHTAPTRCELSGYTSARHACLEGTQAHPQVVHGVHVHGNPSKFVAER